MVIINSFAKDKEFRCQRVLSRFERIILAAYDIESGRVDASTCVGGYYAEDKLLIVTCSVTMETMP